MAGVTKRTNYRVLDKDGNETTKGLKKAYAEKEADRIGGTIEAYTVELTAADRANIKRTLGR